MANNTGRCVGDTVTGSAAQSFCQAQGCTWGFDSGSQEPQCHCFTPQTCCNVIHAANYSAMMGQNANLSSSGYFQRPSADPGQPVIDYMPKFNCAWAKPKAPVDTFCQSSNSLIKSSGCPSYSGTCTIPAGGFSITSEGCKVSVGFPMSWYGCVKTGDLKTVINPFMAASEGRIVQFPTSSTCVLTYGAVTMEGTMQWNGAASYAALEAADDPNFVNYTTAQGSTAFFDIRTAFPPVRL